MAFGTSRHWIYAPIRAGALTHPLSHKAAVVKAGLASAFVYHELKLAAGYAQQSKVLAPAVAALNAATNKLGSMKSSLTNGTANASEIDGLNSQLGRGQEHVRGPRCADHGTGSQLASAGIGLCRLSVRD